MSSRNLELNIEELVLHDFPGIERDRIVRAVQRELERLFAERGIPPSLEMKDEVARIEGGSFEAEPGSSAEEIGVQVAQYLYGGMRL